MEMCTEAVLVSCSCTIIMFPFFPFNLSQNYINQNYQWYCFSNTQYHSLAVFLYVIYSCLFVFFILSITPASEESSKCAVCPKGLISGREDLLQSAKSLEHLHHILSLLHSLLSLLSPNKTCLHGGGAVNNN